MSAEERAGERGGPTPVASPCISVCTLDSTGRVCTGCFRTIDEIAAWSVLDELTKREIVAALAARRAKAGAKL